MLLLAPCSMWVTSSWASSTTSLIDEVVVTATQRSEALFDLPLGVSTIASEDLLTVRPIHANQIFQRVSGAWISRGNGQESLTALRSPVLTGPGSCGAFFMASDGVSLRAPGFCNVNQLFDANTEQAQRIEVIKGPGTALYGSGAMHGVINVISPAPGEQDNQRASLEIGPNNYSRGRYEVGGTRDRHGLYFAANAASDGGYKRSSGFDQSKVNLRHVYTAEELKLDTILTATRLRQETAGFITGFEAYKDSDRQRENPNPDAYRDADALKLQTTATLRLDEFSELSVTPYLRHNEMEFLQHFLPWQSVEKNGHDSVGLSARYYRDGSWLDMAMGLDIDATNGLLKETQALPFSANQPAGVHYDYQVDALLVAPWLQAQWNPVRDLHLSIGARLEQTDYQYNNRTGDGPACEPTATACRFFRPTDRRDSFSNASYNAGLLWDWTPGHATYLRAARGFRAPQTTELYRLQAGQAFAELDSESLTSIEWGARGEHRALSYDIGVYAMRKRDVIFQDTERRNVSGARTVHYGIDFSLRWQLSNAFDLAMDGSLARHEYDSAIALLGSSGNIEGNLIDTAPEHFGSLRLGWDISAGTRAELEWAHMGDYFLDPDNQFSYDGHDLINLRLLTAISRRLDLAVRVTNLTDEDYAERADFGFGSYRYFVGEPRSVFLEIGYRLSP